MKHKGFFTTIVFLDDEVFLKNEEYRDEYVLNDSGVVFVGFKTPKPWNFAQVTMFSYRISYVPCSW